MVWLAFVLGVVIGGILTVAFSNAYAKKCAKEYGKDWTIAALTAFLEDEDNQD